MSPSIDPVSGYGLWSLLEYMAAATSSSFERVAAVDRRLADAGPHRHAVDAHPVEPALRVLLERGVEDRRVDRRPERGRPRAASRSLAALGPGSGPERHDRAEQGGGRADEHAAVEAEHERVLRLGDQLLSDRGAVGWLAATSMACPSPSAAISTRPGGTAARWNASSTRWPNDGRHHAADDGHAERAAHLAGGVVHGRPDAGLRAGQRAHDRLGGRAHREAHAEGEDHEAPGHVAPVADVRRRGCSPSAAIARAARLSPRPTTSFVPHRSTSSGAVGGDDHHHDRHRQQAHAGLERRVLHHELQVLGLQEDEAEHREEQQHDPDAGGGEPRVLEERRVEHGARGRATPTRRTRPAHRRRPRTRRAWLPEVHPFSGAWMIPYTSATSPTIESSAPTRVEVGLGRILRGGDEHPSGDRARRPRSAGSRGRSSPSRSARSGSRR